MALVAERSPGGGRGRAGADRSSGGRPLRARRPVPSGRSVLGALLVAAAAVLVFTAWLGTTSPAGRPWVVAARPLAQGTRLAAGDLSVSSMQLAPATAAGGFARPGALSGRVLDAPLAPGNLVTRADLVPAGGQAALRPVALGVDPSEAAPLSVGGLVDVLVTTGSGPSAQTAVVTRGARLISLAAPASTLGASSG
ncbi:MAG: SAF domain-containing protein, partial [Acidimicrobiales bacterium]